MNLMILDNDPIKAAQYSYDSHSIKMPLEGMQMLCTNARLLLGEEATQHEMMMRSTHHNHPSTIWGRTSSHNFAWVLVFVLFKVLNSIDRKLIDGCNPMSFAYKLSFVE